MIKYDDTTNESKEYQEFVEKFKPKKTTDDCYTPPNVYDAVLNWAVNEYGLEGRPVLRPFYPGGDYLREDYPENCVVIDNPPFSILSQICQDYEMLGVDYFLFAPSLTLFSTASGSVNYVVADCDITYANGANVCTAFVTNLGRHKVLVAPDLGEAVKAADKENTSGKTLPRYVYPTSVITAATLQKLAKHGTRVAFRAEDLHFVRALDAQRPLKKSIFGSGFLLSEQAEADYVDAIRRSEAAKLSALRSRQAREQADVLQFSQDGAIVWQLSEREQALRG